MRRRVVLGILVTVALLTAGAASAAQHDHFPLHPGSAGSRVKGLQWMLAGHCPNRFAPRCGGQVKPTLHRYTKGIYGPRTKAAVLAMRYRLGYPAKGQCGARTSSLQGTVGQSFWKILQGKKTRPRCWVALAAERVKGTVQTGATPAAVAIQKLDVAQLGVHEIPDGSNRGPRISYRSGGYGPYQGSTGAYGQAWCASLADYGLITVVGHGFGSANDAYVPAIAEHAQAHNWLAAKPRVGSFVIFLSNDLQLVNAFHIGYVVRVTASGVQTIEGNYLNGVHEVWRDYQSNHMVYVNVPGVAG